MYPNGGALSKYETENRMVDIATPNILNTKEPRIMPRMNVRVVNEDP